MTDSAVVGDNVYDAMNESLEWAKGLVAEAEEEFLKHWTHMDLERDRAGIAEREGLGSFSRVRYLLLDIIARETERELLPAEVSHYVGLVIEGMNDDQPFFRWLPANGSHEELLAFLRHDVNGGHLSFLHMLLRVPTDKWSDFDGRIRASDGFMHLYRAEVGKEFIALVRASGQMEPLIEICGPQSWLAQQVGDEVTRIPL